MHFNSQKERLFLNQKAYKRNSKQGQLCSACTLLKDEVAQLKEIQQKLAKEIKLIIAFIPRQLNSIILKMKTFSATAFGNSTKTITKTSNQVQRKYSDRRDSNQSKSSAYQSKLKEEDGIIKESIKKELKAIKDLESKQKDLRIVNQKHEHLRKSFSKESINVSHNTIQKGKKLQSSSKLSLSSNTKRVIEDSVLLEQSKMEHQWLNSPKFGSTKEEEKFEFNTRFSSQESKSRKKTESQAKGELEQIKCQNGHECYKGEILNRLPHGSGTLVNCCAKIPFKVNPKTLKYTGSFKFGLFQGKGTLICKDNVRFQGSFMKGMRHGQGTIYLEGASQKGFWQQDKLVFFK